MVPLQIASCRQQGQVPGSPPHPATDSLPIPVQIILI